MNGNFYQNPTFPSNNDSSFYDEKINNNIIRDSELVTSNEDILANNTKKRINVFLTFPNSNSSKEISGILDTIREKYIIVNDSSNNKWYMLKKEYINYIEFLEKPNI